MNRILELIFSGQKDRCCIAYEPCPDANSFRFNTAGNAIYAIGDIGSNCSEDYLVLEGGIFRILTLLKPLNLQPHLEPELGSYRIGIAEGFLSSTSGAIANDVVRDCNPPIRGQLRNG